MKNYIMSLRKRTRLRTKMLVATLFIVMLFMVANLWYFSRVQGNIARTLATNFSYQLMAKTNSGFEYPMMLGDTDSVKREIQQTGSQMSKVLGIQEESGDQDKTDKDGKSDEENRGLSIYITNNGKNVIFASDPEKEGEGIDNLLFDDPPKKALDNALKSNELGPLAALEAEARNALDGETNEKVRGLLIQGLEATDTDGLFESIKEVLKMMSSGNRSALENAFARAKNPPLPLVFEETEGKAPFMTAIQPIYNRDSCSHCHGKKRKILGAMVIQQPMKEVHSAVWKNIGIMGVFSVVALFLLVVIIHILFQGMVTRRLGALQEKTAQVAGGDVNVEVYDDAADSIGRLTRNFNTMIFSIRDRIEYANSLQLGVSDPFFMTDPDRKITYVNEAALKLVGLTAPEVLERPCQEIFLASIYRNECPVRKAIESGEAVSGRRIALTNSKGVEVPILCSAALLKDSSGKILGAFQIMRDLTADVEAETRIREAYAREEKGKKELEIKVIELSEVLGKVSQGDLSPRGVPTGANDSMDVLTHRINETVDGMAALIRQVKEAILPVINGVLRISRENQNLAQRTEQQAAAMEEISATLEELVSNTGENLANTRHADGLSKEAVKVAHEGGSEVERTAQAMSEIEVASAKVVEMMDLINEITFQTNLLSINAAVEAARAGEQGRGFAVVANEVRNLAKRSASASKDIQVLVREIMDKVTTGRQWVGELQGRFTKIVRTSGQVSDALGEVSMGSEESSRGIEQINQGTQEVCEVNEKNASFVDELAQETQKLKEKARKLQELTAVFVLGTEDIIAQQMDFVEDHFEQEPPPPSRSSFGGRERRRAMPTSRALRDDLVSTRPSMEEMTDDLLEQEFEEGFEEF
ncbi:MAG: PAS domain-containing protein [Desulfatibacillum sp.]|nr:PAS domain-containing protein [Desulfatibacillum sp.]